MIVFIYYAFFYSLLQNQHLGWLAIANNAAIKMSAQTSVHISAFNASGYTPTNEITGSLNSIMKGG